MMIPESPHAAAGPSSGVGSPSRPRTGRRIPRDMLLCARPEKDGEGWGLSAKKISISETITAEGALRNLDGETPSREALLAIRSALGVNRTPDGEEVAERTALVCPLDVRFSQLVMKPSFKESEMEVKDTVSQITLKKHDKGDILVCPFAPIRCIWWKPRDGEKAAWFSLDNRRLVALQKRALQCEDPSGCLAEVIVLDRLPDPALVRERGFHGEGYGIDIMGEEWWDWRAAHAAKTGKNDSSDEGSTDSGDETGSCAGGSSSDGCRDADAQSPLSLMSLLSPSKSASSASLKSPAAPISLEAALYNAVSPVARNVVNDEPPPAPWWWPAPQFDAPAVEDHPEEEAENVPGHEVEPGQEATAVSEKKKLRAPPGLERIVDVPISDIPQGVSAPPSFDASCIDLVSPCAAENDDVPPPPTWSADIPTANLLSPGVAKAPTWWPACVEDACTDVGSTPPPPTWSADGSTHADDTSDEDVEAVLSRPPSPSCPPPPAEVSDSTPPPPTYDAPGFEAPDYEAPGFEPSAQQSLPPSVAAPPTAPPKLVVSLEALSDPKAPPSAPPKQLPKLTVSLEELTNTTATKGKAVPSMAPPAYMAPGFLPPQWNGMTSPSYTPQSGYSASYSPMSGSFVSPAAGVPSNWGCF